MKSPIYYLLIIFVSILPFVITLTNPRLIHTSDGGVHLPRIGAYVKALADHHFPVRWAGDLNYGYGLPLFNFMYPAPYLIASAFVSLGTSLVLSLKLVLLISYLLSGVFMYLFAKEFFGDPKKALLVTIFYQFAPFRLVELLIRGAIGGVLAYSFFPLLLYGIVLINKKHSYRAFITTALASCLLLISHNALSLVFFVTSALFICFFVNRKSWIFTIAAVATGMSLSGFYWIPALVEHKYTYGDLFMKDMFRTHFPPFLNFFLPNPLYDKKLLTAEISVQFGLMHVIALGASVYALITKKIKDSRILRLLIFSLVITGIALVVMQPISTPLWEQVTLLRQFQFPWRFLALICFSTSFFVLGLVTLLPKKAWIYWSIIVLTIVSTAYYWYPREGFDTVKENDYWTYPLNTTYFGETDLIWSAGPAKKFPDSRVEFISGKGKISEFVKKTHIHTFTVDVEDDGRLVDHTQYFPGWRVYDGENKIPVEFQDQNWRGLITFALPKGKHTMRVVFEESKVRLIADIISAVAILGVAGVTFFRKKIFS